MIGNEHRTVLSSISLASNLGISDSTISSRSAKLYLRLGEKSVELANNRFPGGRGRKNKRDQSGVLFFQHGYFLSKFRSVK